MVGASDLGPEGRGCTSQGSNSRPSVPKSDAPTTEPPRLKTSDNKQVYVRFAILVTVFAVPPISTVRVLNKLALTQSCLLLIYLFRIA